MKIVITGGAGFIGANCTENYLRGGHDVTIFDNMSRRGSKANVLWLHSLKKKLTVVTGDIRKSRDVSKLKEKVGKADLILHFAGQVAVTTSVKNPREDFEANALGTFNILELLRTTHAKGKLIYASTNKVYGGMENVAVVEKATRYEYKDLPYGISEQQPLDFHSPYGCSKGAGDQYVRDYSRIYGLDTVVFRQSCIYGPRQFGVEDQGWVAWFMIATLKRKPLTIYGNGKQIRDLLYITDLIHAFDAVLSAGNKTKGEIFNIGGGAENSLSVWKEFRPKLEHLFGRTIVAREGNWRPGDQPVYISDTRKAKRVFDWSPTISVDQGLELLFHWIQEHKALFS